MTTEDREAAVLTAINDTRVALGGLTIDEAERVCEVVLEEIRQNGAIEPEC